MNIYILANFTNSQTSRFIEIAKLFFQRGHNVTVVTSDFNHGRKCMRGSFPQYDGFKMVYLHEPGYKGNVTPQRLLSHHVFGKNVAKYLNSN